MHNDDRRYEWGAWCLWAVPVIVIGILVLLNRRDETTMQIYGRASADWWAQGDIYVGRQGMNYLPIFPILFSPFHALGMTWGVILWRTGTLFVLAWGVRRLIATVSPQQISKNFFWGSFFAMPVCLGAVKFGQANVPFAALTTLAAVLLIERRWKLAGAALVGAIAIKPLGIVLALLAVCGYRRVIIPVVVGSIVMLLIPFAFGPPDYVLTQYQGLISNMRDCSQATTETRFANLNGIFQAVSIHIPARLLSVMNVLAALGTLVAWLFAARRLGEPERGLLLLSLATVYLMLFNPMNESNSFVIVAPAITAVAVRCRESANGQFLARFLACLLVGTWVLPELIHSLDPHSRMWGKPLLAGVIFSVVVLARTRRLVQLSAPPGTTPTNIEGVMPDVAST